MRHWPKCTLFDEKKVQPAPYTLEGREKVSIVITNRKSELDNVKLVLQSIRNQTIPFDEIIFVEHDAEPASKSEIEPLVDKYIHLKDDWIFNKSWSINVGVSEARNELIISHDNDLYCENDYLEKVLEEYNYQNKPHMMICWNVLVDIHKEELPFFIKKQYNNTYPIRYESDRRKNFPRLTAPAGSILFTKNFYESIGGHDEKQIGWAAEDTMFFMLCDAVGDVYYNHTIEDIKLYHLHHPPRITDTTEEFTNLVYEYYTCPYLEYCKLLQHSTVVRYSKYQKHIGYGDKVCPFGGDLDKYEEFKNVVHSVVDCGTFGINNITGEVVVPTDKQLIRFRKDVEDGSAEHVPFYGTTFSSTPEKDEGEE